MPSESSQFIGDYEDVPVDPKGRLIVPAAFRRALPMGVNTFVVARWFDGCLAAFDPNNWERVIQQLRGLDGSQRQTRQLMRALVGGSKELKIDRQGRVLVPRKHLGMAGITDRATLVGVIDRVEIWHPDRYADSLNEVDLEGIAEQLDWL